MTRSFQEVREEAKELGINSYGKSKSDIETLIEQKRAVEGARADESIVRDITVTERVNPALEESAIMSAVVAGTETDEQMLARVEKQAREKIMREDAERKLRQASNIQRQKTQDLRKHELTYDIVEMKERCEAIAARNGGTFQIDTLPNGGGLAGTYHMFRTGNVGCGNLAQPLTTIIRDVSIFFKVVPEAAQPKRNDMVRSHFTGEPLVTPITIVGSANAESGDIAAGQ